VKLFPRASEKEALVEISRLRFLRPTKGVFDISMVIAASEQELKAAMASTAEVVEDFMIARSSANGKGWMKMRMKMKMKKKGQRSVGKRDWSPQWGVVGKME
jgi:hypothetical protein